MIVISQNYQVNTNNKKKSNKPTLISYQRISFAAQKQEKAENPEKSSGTLVIAKTWDRASTKAPADFSKKILQVDNFLFRGPQPGLDGLETLKAKGIGVIINLKLDNPKEIEKYRQKAKSLGMSYYNVPMNAFETPKKEQVQEILGIMKKAKAENSKVYVHCMYGKDRTGTVVALYQMKMKGKKFNEAFAEMDKLGYRKKLFPKLKEFLANSEKNPNELNIVA